jgi:lipoate-protein ligase A
MADSVSDPKCRVLPTCVAAGPWQMASDEVMLESAIEGTASLRFYRWSEPTLSLGYFQPTSVRLSDPLLAKLPFVRRATGGATLVHDRELTYALALPAGPAWQARECNWLCRMHVVIAAAFGQLSIKLSQVGSADRRKLGDVLCFLDQTPGDLLSNGQKVVGSAQRKHKSALLQHGAILFEQSVHTPSLPGLSDLTAIPATKLADVESAILAALAVETGWQFAAGDWTDSEIARREQLIAAKYASTAWNDKR